MNAEKECNCYSDDQLQELIRLFPAETIGDRKTQESVYGHLDGKKAVHRMRDHIDTCLDCRTRIEQLAAR